MTELRTEYGLARERFGKTIIEFVASEEEVDGYLEEVREQRGYDGRVTGFPYKVTRQISDWEKVE